MVEANKSAQDIRRDEKHAESSSGLRGTELGARTASPGDEQAAEPAEKVDSHTDDEMVMTSFRLTRGQIRSLEIVSTLTGRKKAEIVREALAEKFERLTSPEEAEALAEASRQRIMREQARLREALAVPAS